MRTPALSAFDDLRVDTRESFESPEAEAGLSINKQTNLSTSSIATNKSNSKKSRELIESNSRQPTVESSGRRKREAPHVFGVGAAQSVKETVICDQKEEKLPKKSGKKRAPAPPQPQPISEPELRRRYMSTSLSSEGSYKLDAAEASDTGTGEQKTIEINLEDVEAKGYKNNKEIKGFGSRDGKDEFIASYTDSGSEMVSEDAGRDEDVTLEKEERPKIHYTLSGMSGSIVPDDDENRSDDSGKESENTRQQILAGKRAEGAISAKQFLKGSLGNVFDKSTTSEDSESDSNRKSKMQCKNTDKNSERGGIKTSRTGKVVHQSQEEAMWAKLELPSEAKKQSEQTVSQMKLESSTSTSEESETEVKKKFEQAEIPFRGKKNKEDGRKTKAKEPREMIVHDKNEKIVLQTSTKDRKKKIPTEFKSGETVKKSKSLAKSSPSGTSDGSISEIENSEAETKSEDKRETKNKDGSKPKGTEHRKLSTAEEARLRFQKQKGVSLPDEDVFVTGSGSHTNEANDFHETRRPKKTEEPQRSNKKSAKGNELKSRSRSQKRESRSSRKGCGNFCTFFSNHCFVFLTLVLFYFHPISKFSFS